MKQQSLFYSKKILDQVKQSLEQCQHTKKIKSDLIKEASWWMEKSYDDLYHLMFSHSLKRSWFVLSYGNCPNCNANVPLYEWIIDAKNHPFKVQCPHCKDYFPKNDFSKYYQSGLDDNGSFSYDSANSNLLVNEEGTKFGVDDGQGYIHTNNEKYMFVATYLVHGHWTNLIVEGIKILSQAYVLTNNKEYAKRAAIMLYSVSKFYKDFDFYEEGVMYEKEHRSNGYVAYWVYTCNELRDLVIAYDQIFDSIKENHELELYLKASFNEIQVSIEQGIFMDALQNREKCEANPPNTDILFLLIKAVVMWDEEKDNIQGYLNEIVSLGTKVDGLSGEKALAGYANIAPNLITNLITLFCNIDEQYFDNILDNHPKLFNTYHIYINSWYANKYYPKCGDIGWFNDENKKYLAVIKRKPLLENIYIHSDDWYLYKLYKYYNNTDFLKVIYINNDFSYDGLFEKDIYISDINKYKNIIKQTIEKEGTKLNAKTINYEQWRIAFLNSGEGVNSRMVYMLYDSGANHSHNEALNVGLYFKGMDITPSFGYSPVSHGGWFTNKVKWYLHPSSHNVVVIDDKEHTNLPEGTFLKYPKYGKTILFEDKPNVKVICAEAKEYVEAKRYERLYALVSINESEAYCIDIFRTIGGSEHIKYQRSTFGELDSSNLDLVDTNKDLRDGLMRNIKEDVTVKNTFDVTWNLIDKENLNRKVYFKYTDVTDDALVSTCESWVDFKAHKEHNDNKTVHWAPTLMIKKSGPISTFSSILEVYENNSNIESIRRLPLENASSSSVCIEVKLLNGSTDVIVSADNEYVYNKKYDIKTNKLLFINRIDRSGKVTKLI